jgi:hypothetical protein
MILKDTSRFQEVWYNFVKTGAYCNYTKDSYAYKEFWLREDHRCRNGLKLNDLYIPGAYYFYLNYYPILAKDEKTGRKSRICPRFTDVDLEYFTIIERARKEQKGVILAKPRRTGFSFKNSCLVTHEYNFYKEAKCVIGAYLSDLSTNTMSMCIDGLNWLDKHTEWKKQRNPDTRTFVKARYKETVDGKIYIKFLKITATTDPKINDDNYVNSKNDNIVYFVESTKLSTLHKQKTSSLVSGTLLAPIKVRPEENVKGMNYPWELSTDISLGQYLGYRIPLSITNPYYITIPTITLGTSLLSINNSNTIPENDSSTTLGLTWSTGIILDLNGFNIALLLGKDYAPGQAGKNWIYNEKTWFSIGFGINLTSKNKDL